MNYFLRKTWFALLVLLLGLPAALADPASGSSRKSLPERQAAKQKKAIRRAVFYDPPGGYGQVGSTDIFCRESYNFDFMGKFGDRYYSSTFSDTGYRLAMKVGDNYPFEVDQLNGTMADGVECRAVVEPQGDLARVIYRVTNTNSRDTVVSLGTHADVMIGDNDSAPIERRRDTFGNTYGLTMRDGGGAQLCLLFGSGLVGVTAVDDFWFGFYSQNYDIGNMVGDYYEGSNWLVENGNYDSGMGWCWKNRTIPAGETVEFSYLIGVGDVNLEPTSSFEVTPDDSEGWNDLSRPHRLTLEGDYTSPFGQQGKVQYAVENSETWTDLTDFLDSGSTFKADLTAMFTPGLETHTIRFRTVDAVGNTSMLAPIVYKDVSAHPVQGIEPLTYDWGNPVIQNNLSSDLPEDSYKVVYGANILAGEGVFTIEGVFPQTIGRCRYTFEILPLALPGSVTLSQDSFVFNGLDIYPEWTFTDPRMLESQSESSYEIHWEDNHYAGTGRLRIVGCNNLCGEIVAPFEIVRAPMSLDLCSYVLPQEDVTYDGQMHPVQFSVPDGAGHAMVTYRTADTETGSAEGSTDAPVEPDHYEVYIEIPEGLGYQALPETKLGEFSIFKLDDADWAAIQRLAVALEERGCTLGWNLDNGPASAANLSGLNIKEGQVVAINLGYSGLTGTFPVEVFDFPHATELYLSGNQLSGTLDTATVAAKMKGNPLETIDLGYNRFSGNIGLFAAAFPNLKRFDVYDNCFSDVIPMISPAVTELYLGNQTLDRQIDLDLSALNLTELAKQIPTIVLYDHGAQSYVTTPELQATHRDSGWGIGLTLKNGKPEIYALDELAYRGQSGDLFNLSVFGPYSSTCAMRMTLNFARGDANFLGGVDATDLQATILYTFNEYPGPFNLTAADTFADGIINVQDVVATVNLLLDMPAAAPKRAAALAAYPAETAAHVYVDGGELILETEEPIAALSLSLTSDIATNPASFGMETAVRGGRLVVYSLDGGSLPAGRHVIGRCDPSATVTAVSASSPDASPVAVGIGAADSTGIIERLANTAPESVEIFTTEGIRIPALRQGVNIVVVDGQSYRLFIRK